MKRFFAKYAARTYELGRHGIIITVTEIKREIQLQGTKRTQLVSPLSHRQHIMLHFSTSVGT